MQKSFVMLSDLQNYTRIHEHVSPLTDRIMHNNMSNTLYTTRLTSNTDEIYTHITIIFNIIVHAVYYVILSHCLLFKCDMIWQYTNYRF